MAEFEIMLHGLVKQAVLDLHTAQICIVTSFNPNTLTCDLQPVFKQTRTDGTQATLSPIVGAPCVSHRFIVNGGEEQEYRPVYHPGDLVLTVVSERAIDHALSGDVADPKFNRFHDLSDAIVVGRLSG